MNHIKLYETSQCIADYDSPFVPRVGDQVQIDKLQYFVREVIVLIPSQYQAEEIRIVVEANIESRDAGRRSL